MDRHNPGLDSVHSTAASVDVAAAAAAAKEAWYNQRRLYRQLRHRKSAEFWCRKIDADRADPQSLWRSVDNLLGRGRMPASELIDVETFNRYFTEKVSKVRSSTSGATPPTFSRNRPGVSFTAFSSVNVDTVIDAVRQLPDKSSAADPMPTSVLKQVVDLVAPYLTELFNRSLATGHFPSGFKEAFITPIVKKAGLDTSDVSTYRPISNLTVVSKLQRAPRKDSKQTEDSEQPPAETSRYNLGRKRQHTKIFSSGSLLLSWRILCPSLGSICTHQPC